MELAELVTDVKAGKEGAMLELWEAVKQFVYKQANRRANAPGCRVSVEDFEQAGFLAMIDAVEAYDNEREHGFLKLLAFKLKNRFAYEQGVRSATRDAMYYADSFEDALQPDNPESKTYAELVDLIEDEDAELSFVAVEFADFLLYCRGIINAAIDTATPTQAETIRANYFEGRSLVDIAEQRGTSRQAVYSMERYAFDKILCGKYRPLLRECLDVFNEINGSVEASCIKRPTEAAALHDTAA